MPHLQPSDVFATNVRAELARRRYGQADLAAELGIPAESLRRRLRSAPPFNLNEASAVAAFLGVPLSDLLGDRPAQW